MPEWRPPAAGGEGRVMRMDKSLTPTGGVDLADAARV